MPHSVRAAFIDERIKRVVATRLRDLEFCEAMEQYPRQGDWRGYFLRSHIILEGHVASIYYNRRLP